MTIFDLGLLNLSFHPQSLDMDEKQQKTTAPHLFDDPKADIILKTSDGVEFRTYKLFLSLASPFFESLFNLPQPMDAPSVDVCEDSRSLVKLLSWCDHRISPSTDVDDLLDALVLADKYSMAYITSRIQEALTDILKSDPTTEDVFAVFAIAYKLRLEDLVKVAARSTLMTPGLDKFPHVKQLELIPAIAMHQLAKYHALCRDSIPDVCAHYGIGNDSTSPLSNFREDNSDCLTCGVAVVEGDCEPGPKWLEYYADTIAAYFCRRTAPCATYASKQGVGKETELLMKECIKCYHKIEEFHTMRAELAKWIDDNLYKVCQ